MKFLLDVNALLACEHPGSPHHNAFHVWVSRVGRSNLASCALVELGFLRVSLHVFGYSLAQGHDALTVLKKALGGFVSEAPPPRLPSWADTPARTTDGYLVQLAKSAGLELATFDRGIRGAVLIAG